MGAERRLLVAAALLVLAAALVSAGPLAAPPEEEAQTGVQPAVSGVQPDTTGQTAPAPVKTGRDQASVQTGSGDGTETAGLTTGQTEAADQTQSKIYGSNSAAETFFTYGATLTSLIYGLMGVSYFYGPYSREAVLAQRRAERRKKYLQQMVGATEAPEEQDYGRYTGGEADSSSGGLFGQIQIPAQYTITRREDVAQEGYSGTELRYDPGYDPGYAAGYRYREEEGAYEDDRYQLVMARGDPAAVEGVNRRGLEEVIPIRLPRQSGPSPPVVNVLDMQSADCQAWVTCLQDRSRKMQEQQTSLSPTEFDSTCELFLEVCPTRARSIDSLKRQ